MQVEAQIANECDLSREENPFHLPVGKKLIKCSGDFGMRLTDEGLLVPTEKAVQASNEQQIACEVCLESWHPLNKCKKYLKQHSDSDDPKLRAWIFRIAFN